MARALSCATNLVLGHLDMSGTYSICWCIPWPVTYFYFHSTSFNCIAMRMFSAEKFLHCTKPSHPRKHQNQTRQFWYRCSYYSFRNKIFLCISPLCISRKKVKFWFLFFFLFFFSTLIACRKKEAGDIVWHSPETILEWFPGTQWLSRVRAYSACGRPALTGFWSFFFFLVVLCPSRNRRKVGPYCESSILEVFQ